MCCLKRPLSAGACCLNRTMIAQWTTRDAGRPVVRWGRESGRLAQENGGSFSTYTRLQMCGAPANSTGWVDPGWLNYAALTGLQPGTRYYYAVGDPVSRHFFLIAGMRMHR